MQAYNDIVKTVDGASISGTTLFSQTVTALRPQAYWRLLIDNPPAQVYTSCAPTTAGGLPATEVSLAQGADTEANPLGVGYCPNAPHAQLSNPPEAMIQLHNWSDQFDAQRQVRLQVTGSGFAQLALPDDQTRQPEDCVCADPSPQPSTSHPVNTRTGNFWTQVTDLAVETPGPMVTWTRTYSSQAINETASSLGPGWQHPFAARLVTPAMPGGEAGRLIIFSGRTNRLRFTGNDMAGYLPAPGVYSTLRRAGSVYVQTLRDQQQLHFDALSGLLIELRDPQDRRLVLTYSGTPARLTRITDAGAPGRYLALTYSPLGQIETVSDGIRSVRYLYSAAGDLYVVQDVLQRPTTYTYQNHLLTRITNGLNQIVEQMTYDQPTAAGKVTHQTLLDGRQISFTYLPNETTVTTQGASASPIIERYVYGRNNALREVWVNGVQTRSTAFDQTFSPRRDRDGNGQLISRRSTVQGLPVKVIDPLGATIRATYDAANNMTSMTDQLGVTTSYTYDTFNRRTTMTQGITSTTSIRAVTNYRYDGEVLKEIQTPDGVLTRYLYTDARFPRLPTRMVVGAATPAAQTTAYEYDTLGRVIRTTLGFGTPAARTDTIAYRADTTIEQTIQNYQDGAYDPAQPDTDLITSYGYDSLGRPIWVRDPLGRYDVTSYNDHGHVAWVVRNMLNPNDGRFVTTSPLLPPAQTNTNVTPIAGYTGALPTDPPPYSPAQPDTNVATHYAYDGFGRTTLMTQTGILTGTFNPVNLRFSAATNRVTQFSYDDQGRLARRVVNLRPAVVSGSEEYRYGIDLDGNLETVFTYDAVGNLTGVIDSRTGVTLARYDARNQPIRVVQNVEDGNPLTFDPGSSAVDSPLEVDRTTVTAYDAVGRVREVIEQYLDGIPDAATPDADRITRYTYDTLGHIVTTTANGVPADRWKEEPQAPALAAPPYNRAAAHSYDPLTQQLQGERDVLGRWASYHYDSLGRLTATVQNCRDTADLATSGDCAAFDANYPDRNVLSAIHYDARGRIAATIAPDGVVQQFQYDGVDRPIAQIANAIPNIPSAETTNVTIRTSYDAGGRPTVHTDATQATTHIGYNLLDQTTMVTDSVGRVTQFGYDGTGTLRWIKRNDGQLTVVQVDGLGRPRATIVNYQDGVVSANEPADQDLITLQRYTLAGHVGQVVDPQGRVTSYRYSQRGLLALVSENEQLVAGERTCTAPAQAPCNLVTRYAYDRAGNRTAIRDARGNAQLFAYDAADQVVATADMLGRQTFTRYDAGGRRVQQTNGIGTVAYTYDDQDRLISARDTAQANHGFTWRYDVRGRRVREDILTTGVAIQYTYDPLDRLIQVTDGVQGTVGYHYDAAGRRTRLTYPNGATVATTYWSDGQLKTVAQGGTTLASYQYDSAGRMAQLSRANGAVTTYRYDGADRLTDQHTTIGGATVNRFQYTLDRLGLRTQTQETLGSGSRSISYTYDGLLRLTSANVTPGPHYAYTYDAAGNRTRASVDGIGTTRSYDAANQVIGWQYDAAGNLLRDDQQTLTYDLFGQLTRRSAHGQTTDYTATSDGVLLSATTNGATTRYTQDLATPLAQILSDGTSNYVYGHERLAAQAGSTTTWYANDALGSVRQTLNASGAVLSTTSYDPWGQLESGSLSTFGFTGERQDAGGLVYLRARWYDPASGMFPAHRWRTSESRSTVPYSHHPYAYALSNPVNYTDPTGKCVFWLDPTCRPVWEGGTQYTGWQDFQQYSVGVVEGMGSLGAAIANVTRAETWEAAGRGWHYLVTDLNGSVSYLCQQLLAPVAQAARHPIQTLQILNQNPRQFGHVLGGTTGTLAIASGIARIGNAVRHALPGPKVSPYRFDPKLRAGEGATDMFGNIDVSPHGTMLDRMRAIFHEQVHSFFTPRGIAQLPRARFSQWVYNHSHLFRYLEEATAESVAQLQTGGSLRTGLLFPMVEGYVSPWRVAIEGALVSGGTVVIGNAVGGASR